MNDEVEASSRRVACVDREFTWSHHPLFIDPDSAQFLDQWNPAPE